LTAIRSRRKRNTWVAVGASLLSLAAVGVLGLVGVATLADSTAGQLADGQKVAPPSQRLPYTATALIGVADPDGYLTSVVVAVLDPDGAGGTLIVLAASADAAAGRGDSLVPLNAALQVSGPDAFREAAERAAGLSFDVIEIVDERRFVQLVTPLGDLPTVMPIELLDSSSGEQWAPGSTVLTAASAARVLTARNDAIADWYHEPARASVWEAVADRVGAGIGTVEPIESDLDLPPINNLDQFLDRLFAGPVEAQSLRFDIASDQELAEFLPYELATASGPDSIPSVVVHDRAETLMAFGSIAPARLGAPADGPMFRVINGYSEADLAGFAGNRSDVLKFVLNRLLFARSNILSVVDLPESGSPEITQVRVADPTLIDDVRELYGSLLGPIEIGASSVQTDGIDIEIELGKSLIGHFSGELADSLAGSVGDASTNETNDANDDGTQVTESTQVTNG
jgi:hypothetical protein